MRTIAICLLLLFLSAAPGNMGPAQAGGLLQDMAGRPPAPDFTLPDIDGKTHTLSGYRGKVVIVNFWATWCPPCRKEVPSMQRAYTALEGTNVVMLAIHVGGNEDRIWSFLTDMDVTFPVLVDVGSKTGRKWPLRGLPTTFVVDRQGRIALRAIGGREWDDPAILKTIRALAN
ncbi:MAG TPA: redoxin domain-containing protein [Rhizobiales bacterium]|nr:redoxin domain-containing protein [Hyphomicrobiales bacterium]